MVVEVEVFPFCQKLPLPNNNSRALAALWRRACRAALELGIPSPARIQPLQYPTNDPHNRQLPSKAGEKCEVIVIPRLPAPRAIVVDLMVFSEL